MYKQILTQCTITDITQQYTHINYCNVQLSTKLPLCTSTDIISKNNNIVYQNEQEHLFNVQKYRNYCTSKEINPMYKYRNCFIYKYRYYPIVQVKKWLTGTDIIPMYKYRNYPSLQVRKLLNVQVQKIVYIQVHILPNCTCQKLPNVQTITLCTVTDIDKLPRCTGTAITPMFM